MTSLGVDDSQEYHTTGAYALFAVILSANELRHIFVTTRTKFRSLVRPQQRC